MAALSDKEFRDAITQINMKLKELAGEIAICKSLATEAKEEIIAAYKLKEQALADAIEQGLNPNVPDSIVNDVADLKLKLGELANLDTTPPTPAS